MKKLYLLIASAFACLALVAVGAFANIAPVTAATATDCSGSNCIDQGKAATNAADGNPTDLTVVIKNVVNVMLFIVGVGAVVMIIYSGIRYIFSGGNSGSITSAKNTMIYAIIGLVIAILAYAIVNFVMDSVKS